MSAGGRVRVRAEEAIISAMYEYGRWWVVVSTLLSTLHSRYARKSTLQDRWGGRGHNASQHKPDIW